MGGGGTKISTSGGTTNTTSTQQAVIPDELKPLYSSTANQAAALQSALPLTGTIGYTGTISNPAYEEWAKQYGQYNMPGGGVYGNTGPDIEYYSNYGGNPQKITADEYNKIMEQYGPETLNAYHMINGQVNWGKPTAEQLSASNSGIQIPAAPAQYIGDPTTAYQKTPDFTANQIQGIAPLSDLEKAALELIPSLSLTPEAEQLALEYAKRAPESGSRTPSAADMYSGFEESPYYKSALGAFQSGAIPTLQNQMALAGLGTSSTLGKTLTDAWAQQVPNVLSQYATQYVEPEMGRQERGIERESNMYQSLAPVLSAMGSTDTARLKQTIDSMLQGGGLSRSLEQAINDANYNNMLRQQALAEEALFTPMGMLLPSSIGQRTSTVGTQGQSVSAPSGGGLFK